MHWLHHCLIIAVVWTGSTLNAVDECAAPPPCFCSGRLISCSSRKLNVIPSFRKTAQQYETIFLDYNNITRVEAKAFSNLSTSTYMHISLNVNPISYVDQLAFVGLENISLSLLMSGTRLLALPRALATLHLKTLGIDNLQALDPSVMRAMRPSLKTFDIGMQGLAEWPDEMKYLTNLTSLTIIESPSLPDHAFNSSRDSIKSLSLFNSTLRNSPDVICDLNHLNQLHLEYIDLHIRLSELIPTCHRPMITVKHLQIFNIGLSYIPDVFTTFPRLTELSFFRNNITHIDEHTIPSENELAFFALRDNNLHSIPYAIRKMKKLLSLNLSENKITSVEDQDFYNMSNLLYLILDDNPIEHISESAFTNCPSLNILQLSGTALVTVPRAILHLPNIRSIYLKRGKIECNCDLHWLSDRALLYHVIFGNCYQSSERIYDWVRTKSRLCHTSPIG